MMEEKRKIKISLSTFFLILAIIVIVIMTLYIYKLYINFENANNKIDYLNNQISKMKNDVNISKTNTDLNNNEVNSSEKVFSQENKEQDYSVEEVKQVLEKYLNLEGAFAGSPLELLYELGYKKSSIEDFPDKNNYIKTNIKYDEFKQKMLEYMSEELFEKFNTYIDIENCYKNVNGYLYVVDSGSSGHKHKVESIELKSKDSYVGKAYFVYVTGEYSDETYDFNFTISSHNGKCIINTIDACNILSPKEYQISGTYYQKNAQGDEPSYAFLSNNKVTYGSLWTCSGTYTISNSTIKISFTSAVDPDGNKANVKDYGVKESVELTIIDDNNLKDNSDGVFYSK